MILARQPGAVRLDVGPAVVVRHPRYEWPQVSGAERVEWDAFTADPRRWLRPERRLVVVGLTRLMTPGNRTDEVFEVLFNTSPDVEKISVDRALFVAEPWRAWFHWGLVGATYREYTYSYLAESHWRAAHDGEPREDPFTLNELVRWGHGVVEARDPAWFDDVTVEVVEVDAETDAAYQAEKALAFEEEHAAPALVRRLSAFAQRVCPQRSIPTAGRLFDRQRHRIVRTSLRVDEYLVGELLAAVRLHDGVLAALHGGA